MNRMVHDHYPVERLPEDLRGPLDLAQTVRVVIEADGVSAAQDPRVAAAVADLRERRKKLGPCAGDAVARVRALRDEWDL